MVCVAHYLPRPVWTDQEMAKLGMACSAGDGCMRVERIMLERRGHCGVCGREHRCVNPMPPFVPSLHDNVGYHMLHLAFARS